MRPLRCPGTSKVTQRRGNSPAANTLPTVERTGAPPRSLADRHTSLVLPHLRLATYRSIRLQFFPKNLAMVTTFGSRDFAWCRWTPGYLSW